MQNGLLHAPIPYYNNDFPVVQYADDTILIMQADINQVVHLKQLLAQFTESTGLKVNYHKSSMIPINVLNSKMDELASAFGCQVATMPFTYLGLPMGTTKPKMEDLTPLMDRVERKLVSCSNYLSYSGRLQMINSAISPITTYAMCSIKLPVGVIENIDRIRRQCLWRGNDATKKGGNLAAWHMVQKPKSKGGLGVINLRLQNDALLLKHLHKFYAKKDIPWANMIWTKYYLRKVPHASSEVGSFWWKDVLRLNTLYRGIAKCTIGDGSTITFWEDLWTDEILASKYPIIFSFTKNRNISVKEIMGAEDLDSLFHLPLSIPAMEELIYLQYDLASFPYNADSMDTWTLIWGNQVYTTCRYYHSVYQNLQASPIYRLLWKSKCTPRIKFFAWLMLVDRLNTKSMLVRRHFNVQPNAFCVMCTSATQEDADHLFFSCSFATACWNKLGINWSNTLGICDRLLTARQSHALPFFLEIFFIASWELWNLRNAKKFDSASPTLQQWLHNFKHQAHLQLLRVREIDRPTIAQWIDSIM